MVPDMSDAHPVNKHPSLVGAGMQSGKVHPNVAVDEWAEDANVPPLALNVIVYCAAGCVVAESDVLSTLTVAKGER